MMRTGAGSFKIVKPYSFILMVSSLLSVKNQPEHIKMLRLVDITAWPPFCASDRALNMICM